MPRFYIFSTILSMLIGVLVYRMVEKAGADIPSVAAITALVLMLYLNEKKAVFENRIGSRGRKVLALLGIFALVLLWGMALLRAGLFLPSQ